MLLPFPTFGYEVQIVFTSDIEGSCRARGAYIPEDATIDAYCFRDEEAWRSSLLFPYNVGYGTIAHEAWHAARNMLIRVNAGFENEVVAYHLGYIVEEASRFHKKLKASKIIHRPRVAKQ